MTPARILIIAGSDSGGGAGIQADIKTVTMLGGHAMTAITAITAENTLGVQAVHPVPTDMVLAQMESCISDIGVDAVKIGMIGSGQTAAAVAAFLSSAFPRGKGGSEVPIVFDPVMVATSGSILADGETIAAFEALMALATLVTPNIPELAALGGADIARLFSTLILAKGGHGDGPMLADRLIGPAGEIRVWCDPRIDTVHSHGTGCTLASAIATGLGQGLEIEAAIDRARLYVREALRLAPGLGQGHGPMGVPLGFAANA
ncbi:bifunctional hydroxymethylpyrimidine kinase/phosphomethylpyrimidine kinase [Sphingobium sp. AN558]|uniref:bifunctional hydroxymethylpyrimidine kinase/phosphomethylpyrimidine kinase n=1 Tax=Sphingobium sp. AN558 TaxID=3133442 RepID=UPI0030C42D0E